jgi:hypothetical protein
MLERIMWCNELGEANWIGPLLSPPFTNTGSIVPAGFEAYCRIFHPIEGNGVAPKSMRWSDLATMNGRVGHPEMQFHAITRPQGVPAPEGYERGVGPEWGSLPHKERRELVRILGLEMSNRCVCYFLIWDGYGDVSIPTPRRVTIGGRAYALYSGPIEDCMKSLNNDSSIPSNSPNMWWPEDRSWIVVTDIDFAWTYVGGSVSLISNILQDSALEALSCNLGDSPFFDGDQINQ